MNQKRYFLPATAAALVLCLLLFFLAKIGALSFIENSVSLVLFPVAKVIALPFQSFSAKPTELDSLQAENAKLLTQLSNEQQLEEDNKALRDQFETNTIPSSSLLPARVVGMPNVIPPLSYPEEFVVDRGSEDGIEKGMVVVYKDNLVGEVSETTSHFAKVLLVTTPSVTFAGKDSSTTALGVIKGQGAGQSILDNVLLSETLKVGDIVVTNGGQDIYGKGYPQGLVVGKITGVEKDPSALFQKARLSVLYNVEKLIEVFILR